MPLEQHCGRHLDILPQPVSGVPAEKQAVEKRRFPLREFEVITNDFARHELCNGRCHGESAVYRKTSRRQVGPRVQCRVPGNSPRASTGSQYAARRTKMTGAPILMRSLLLFPEFVSEDVAGGASWPMWLDVGARTAAASGPPPAVQRGACYAVLIALGC